MERIEKVLNMKRELVRLANHIKENRKNHCWSERTDARHLHMLYGVFRGLPMARIEAKCREPLSEYWLQKINEKFDLGVNCEEVIRYSRSVLI